MLQIKLNDQEIRRLIKDTHRIPQSLNNPNFLNHLGFLLAAQGKKNISQASADGRSSYTLLKPKTLAQKTKQKYSSKPLTRTGDLIKSIYHQVSGNEVFLTAKNYAKYHQFGTRKMVERPIFSVRENNKRDIIKILKNTISKIIHNLSFITYVKNYIRFYPQSQ